MRGRIHLVVDEAEKERFRRQAATEGKSLSSWLRDVARERLEARSAAKLDTAEGLRAFFAECDRRETGKEPDWAQHRRVIESSIRSGAADE